MARRAHWLRPNPRTKIPQWHICCATTIRPVPGSPGAHELDWAGWSVIQWAHGRPTVSATGTEDRVPDFWGAIKGVLDEVKTAWLWFLRPSQDMPALRLTELVARGELARDWWVWADPPVIIAGRLWGHRVRIVGTDNWLASSAADIADVLPDYHSLPGPTAAAIMPSGSCAWELARCKTLVQSILSFVHREDLGHLCSTVGAQSLQSYRHLHMGEHKILVDDCAPALALERSAAIGFPVRCWRTGKIAEAVYTVDVNALYPWVMHSYPYPRKRVYCGPSTSVDNLRRQMAGYLCIARVSGSDPDRHYAVQREGETVYASELVDDVLCGPDLDSFVTRGHCTGSSRVCCYESANLFDQWGQWAWDLRCRYRDRRDRIGLPIAKSLSVSLWGKFAGRLGRWESAGADCPHLAEYGKFGWVRADGTTSECRAIAGVIDVLDGSAEPAVSCPAISAYVACYARTYMDGIIGVAGQDEVIYQVADSLHLTTRGFRAVQAAGLIDPTGFGRLKTTGPHFDAYYHAANIYRMAGRWRHAGRPVFAVQGDDGAWRWESPDRLSQSVLRRQTGTVPVCKHEVRLEVFDGRARMGRTHE